MTLWICWLLIFMVEEIELVIGTTANPLCNHTGYESRILKKIVDRVTDCIAA